MGDIGMIKGGLAWLLWQGGVVVDVVDHRGSIGLGVYRREEGEETVNIKQHSIRKHNVTISKARGVLTRCYMIPVRGEVNRKCFPGSGPVSDR